MADFLTDILFIFQRLNWLSVIDILLVTLIFFGLIYLLRDTQAMLLLRGVLSLLVGFALLTVLVDLPAFSWLLATTLPALLLAIPVIFAPEIRRALERIGRAGKPVQRPDNPLSPGFREIHQWQWFALFADQSCVAAHRVDRHRILAANNNRSPSACPDDCLPRGERCWNPPSRG